MTDRLKGCTVVFQTDIRTDDVKPILAAIGQIKGVLKVEPSLSAPDDWFAIQRVRQELGTKLIHLIYPPEPRSI